MTTVREIDRLVVSDDAFAARLWPRLGPKVRDAYLHDRDAWVVLRRTVEAGASLPAATLAAEQKVFLGWARALRAAAAGKTKRRPRSVTVARRAGAPASAAAAATASSTRAIFPPPTAASTPLAATAAAAVTKVKGGAGTAVAGGLVLAGLIAVAARRKRA